MEESTNDEDVGNVKKTKGDTLSHAKILPCCCLCTIGCVCLFSIIALLIAVMFVVGRMEDDVGRSSSFTPPQTFPFYQTLLLDENHNITSYGLSSFKNELGQDYVEQEVFLGDVSTTKFIYKMGMDAFQCSGDCFCGPDPLGRIYRVILAYKEIGALFDSENLFPEYCRTHFDGECSESITSGGGYSCDYISKVKKNGKMDYYCKGKCATDYSSFYNFEDRDSGCNKINHDGVIEVECPEGERSRCSLELAKLRFAMDVLDVHCRKSSHFQDDELCFAYDSELGVNNATIFCRETL